MRGLRMCAVVGLAASLSALSATRSRAALPTDFVEEAIVTGLAMPNSMAFLPDGRLLFTELASAKVRMVVQGHIAATDPALTVPGVTSDGLERGLQGIAVDPRWPASPYLYVCFTYTGSRMRLVRYTGSGDLALPAGENLTFASPLILIDDFRDLFSNHNGLGLRFGLDGHLLMTTGDDGDPCSSQTPDSLRGVLLRLDVSQLPVGAGGPVAKTLLIPPDNPLSGPGTNARLVYAYGMRNPWRFHVDRLTGSLLLADVGQNDYEELNEVFAGNNFGWPFREGPMVRTQSGCTEPGGSGGSAYDAPILAPHQSTGYTSILTADVYRPVTGAPANWPTPYHGNLFYGDFLNGRLRRLERSGPGWAAPAPVAGQPNADDWATELPFQADFLVGPDGSLWWLKMWNSWGSANTGSLRRVRYIGPPVDAPLAPAREPALAAAPNPFRGRVELTWRIAQPGAPTVEVFDPGGRRIRRLAGGDAPSAREGRVVWDGRDDRGAPVAAGLYLARLLHPGGRELLRLVRFE